MNRIELTEIRRQISTIEKGLGRAVLGQDALIRGLLIGLIADGHVLIEGVPGLAKTRAVNLLARCCRMTFKRLQFTPDLLPADVVGTRIYNQQSSQFEIIRGPVFAHFVLVDEINRAPAKVQSALLEVMQEKQVTIGQETMRVDLPFLVFATQNPIEQEGTYPLPEAQLDRFLMKLVVPYPDPELEPDIVRMVLEETELPDPEVELQIEDVLKLQQAGREVFIEDRLLRYVSDITQATRRPAERGLELASYVSFGASPRASIALARAACARALIDGRDAVTPDDVKAVAFDVLRHRILLTYFADAEGVVVDRVINEVLSVVEVP